MGDPLIGKQLGPYVIGPHLNEGAMGVIYRAYKPNTNKPFVVKMMLPEYDSDQQIRKRFEREVALLQTLTHPYIIPVVDFGEQDGLLYFVMPFIQGASLMNLLQRTKFSPETAWLILDPIAQALDFAHDHGVIHRDLKPSNILVEPDTTARPDGMHPYLADFGLSKPVGQSSLTEVGMSVGTPRYMAPEQVRAQPVTPQTDVYALGIVLYELLLGRVPFDDDSPEIVAVKQIRELPPAPFTLNINFPQPLENVILKALSKIPEKRYKTAGAMRSAYWEALQIVEPAARNQSYSIG
jgi:serine/threonine-protein kinase